MADEKQASKEPTGLGIHNQGREAEIAREQGWGTDEEKRTKKPGGRRPEYGGKGYDYGAQDFGNVPEETGEINENKKTA